MSYIFTLDGTGYNVGVESISRKARIADGQNSDDALSGYHWRDLQGTFYDYTMRISSDGMSREEYIEIVEDEVEYMDDGTCWGGLTVTFYAREPKKVPT